MDKKMNAFFLIFFFSLIFPFSDFFFWLEGKKIDTLDALSLQYY